MQPYVFIEYFKNSWEILRAKRKKITSYSNFNYAFIMILIFVSRLNANRHRLKKDQQFPKYRETTEYYRTHCIIIGNTQCALHLLLTQL